MNSPELRDYIIKEQKSGKSRPEIVKTLLANGWEQADIDLAFVSLSTGVPLPSQVAADGLKPFMELLRESWAILKHRLWTFVAIAVIPSAIIFIGTIIVSGGSITASFMRPANIGAESTDWLAAFSVIWVVIMVISVVASIMCNLALLYLAANWDTPVGFREAYAYAWSRFGPGLWLQILVGAAIYGGMVLFAVPGIIASIALMFSMCVFVAEETGGFEALLRSHAYVYKRWWAVWWRLFLFGLLASAAMLVLWLPAMFTLGIAWTAFFMLYQGLAMIFTFQLYKSAKATAKQNTMSGKRTQYLIHVIIGAIVIVGVFVAMAIGLAVGLSGIETGSNFNFNINSSL